MSSTKTNKTPPASSKKKCGKSLTQGTRIDAAHHISGQNSDSTPEAIANSAIVDLRKESEALAASEPPKVDLQNEQLKRQADQLAEYLRNRQKELDHREAQMNAEIAHLESDVRKTRLWLFEREAELEERQKDLDCREKNILERLERLASADAALKRKTETETGLGNISAQLAAENKRLAHQLATLEEARCQWENQHQQLENNVQAERQQEQEDAEKRLSQAQVETQELYEQLARDRRELHEEIRQERARLIVQQRQSSAELDKKRQALQERSEHVDRCRAALMQLRAELQQMHRETLEIRLTTEELWIKLSGLAPPAALTHSLGKIRNRLADQYRLANAEILEHKKELETVRNQLVQQYEKLVDQKQQFEQWIQYKQEESQQQASMLIAREQTLLEQQTHFDEQSKLWQVEKLSYEQEIRRLRLKLTRQNEETINV